MPTVSSDMCQQQLHKLGAPQRGALQGCPGAWDSLWAGGPGQVLQEGKEPGPARESELQLMAAWPPAGRSLALQDAIETQGELLANGFSKQKNTF